MVKDAVQKEPAWKEVLEPRDKVPKEKRKIKRCIYQSKKEVN